MAKLCRRLWRRRHAACTRPSGAGAAHPAEAAGAQRAAAALTPFRAFEEQRYQAAERELAAPWPSPLARAPASSRAKAKGGQDASAVQNKTTECPRRCVRVTSCQCCRRAAACGRVVVRAGTNAAQITWLLLCSCVFKHHRGGIPPCGPRSGSGRVQGAGTGAQRAAGGRGARWRAVWRAGEPGAGPRLEQSGECLQSLPPSVAGKHNRTAIFPAMPLPATVDGMPRHRLRCDLSTRQHCGPARAAGLPPTRVTLQCLIWQRRRRTWRPCLHRTRIDLGPRLNSRPAAASLRPHTGAGQSGEQVSSGGGASVARRGRVGLRLRWPRAYKNKEGAQEQRRVPPGHACW